MKLIRLVLRLKRYNTLSERTGVGANLHFMLLKPAYHRVGDTLPGLSSESQSIIAL